MIRCKVVAEELLPRGQRQEYDGTFNPQAGKLLALLTCSICRVSVTATNCNIEIP